jgi:hypothetical protein
MTDQRKTSVNHIAFIGEYEFFTSESGDLYRARDTNAFDINGYRLGGRWEAPPHMIEATLELHRSFVYQPELPGLDS